MNLAWSLNILRITSPRIMSTAATSTSTRVKARVSIITARSNHTNQLLLPHLALTATAAMMITMEVSGGTMESIIIVITIITHHLVAPLLLRARLEVTKNSPTVLTPVMDVGTDIVRTTMGGTIDESLR